MHLAWLLVVVICLGLGGWQLAVWLNEIRAKKRQYESARAYALARGKPLLVAGGPWGNRRFRRLVRLPAHGSGDVCLDIDGRAIAGHPSGVIATVTHIPFSDKSFGAAFASHLLEHLPGIDDGRQALSELKRTAEAVFIAYPSRQSIAGWLMPGHHLWVWQSDGITYLKLRGRSTDKKERSFSNLSPLPPSPVFNTGEGGVEVREGAKPLSKTSSLSPK